jgi:hypothetical protein
MIKDFKFKKSEGRIILDNCFFGIGFMIDFVNPVFFIEKELSIRLDFFFLRFWVNFYK